MNSLFFDDYWVSNKTREILEEVCKEDGIRNAFTNGIEVLPYKRNSLSIEETPCIWFDIVSNNPYEDTITDNEIEEYSLFSIQIEIYVSENENYSNVIYLKNRIKQTLQNNFNMRFTVDREATSYVDKVKRRLLTGRSLIDNTNKIFYNK